VLAQGQVTPAGMVPRTRSFTVAGIFEAGHFDFDAALSFVHIEDAQRLERQQAPSGLRLRIANMREAPQVAAELKTSMKGDLVVRDWPKLNANWYAAVQTEKKMMFIILTLIIAVAAFNLVSSLVMTVTEKQADIAILRTLGASPGSIMKIFMVQGAVVGVLGTLAGVAMGVGVSKNIGVIVPFIERLLGVEFLSKDIYLISTVPSELYTPDVVTIGIVSVVLAFAATIYPSWAASRVKPAEALRYE
jgi:lipoprotein-releasing system permease protein